MRQTLLAAVLLVLAAPLRAIAPGPELAAAPSHWASVDGVRVHYKSLGRGKPVLVFIHGLGGDMNVWREQVAYFAPRYRVIVLDLPGFGESDKPASAKYTMRFFARAVRGVMDDAKVERAILIGHSMGAPIVRTFDRYYPTRSRGLVTVDGALLNNLPAEQAETFVAQFRGADYATQVASMFDSMTAQASPALREELRSAAVATPQHVFVSAMEGMFRDPSVWTEQKITVPLLVVNTKSPMWSEKYKESLRALAPDLHYVTVDEADHFLMLEQPDALNKAIETWMRAKKWIR
jgi:pimeloyl-ACP methyl ester carboxylesterase